MGRVNAGLVVGGIIDGTTIVYDIAVVEGDATPTSLLQFFDEAKCLPDWASIWTNRTSDAQSVNSLPRIFIRAYDTSTGQDVTHTVNITNVYYNGSLVGWDSNGISSSQGGVPGMLKKLGTDSAYTITYNGHALQSVMMIGNPASALYNPDDDRISFDGTVVSGGGQIAFSGIGTNLSIREISDANAGYSVELLVPVTVAKFIMTDSNNAVQPTQRLARLYYNGSPVSVASMTGIQFKFYDITGPTEVLLTNQSDGITIGQSAVSGDLITIGPSAVDSLMTLRCRVLDANNNELCSDTSAIYDLSDPYSVKWVVADDTSGTNPIPYTGTEPRLDLRSGQTKYIFPKLLTDKGDSFPAGSSAASVTWTFNADDAITGDPISNIPGIPSSSGQTYCSISYSDVVITNAAGDRAKRPVIIHAQSSEF